jgi:hypothetical protein
VLAVLTVSLIMLAAGVYVFGTHVGRASAIQHVAYSGYAAMCGVFMFRTVYSLRRYRYRRPPPDCPPVFERFFIDGS